MWLSCASEANCHLVHSVLGFGILSNLTHNVSFNEPSDRIDDWVVLEPDTTWGAHGRVLVSQRMWDFKTDRFVMTVSQEALVLLKQKQAKMQISTIFMAMLIPVDCGILFRCRTSV